MVELGENVLRAVSRLQFQPNVAHWGTSEARAEAEKYGFQTKHGNFNFVSSVKNRSAGATVYIGGPRVAQSNLNARQNEIIKNLPNTLEVVHSYLEKAPLARIDLTMGQHCEFAPRCTLYVSTHRRDSARLAYMMGQTLFPRDASSPGPDTTLIYIPEWQEKDRQIIVYPETGVTYVLGSDYYGEAKKGFLRMAMWHAKEQGMLGIHAGAKLIHARRADGQFSRYSVVIFGMTATGKTTHTCHNHGLVEAGEGIEIVQDDFVALRMDGSAIGTERGFYVKTEGLNQWEQALLYNAALSPDAILENVMVDFQGNFDFEDSTLTGNGRCIIQKADLGPAASTSNNLPSLEEVDGMIVIFITRRNTVVPIASKLDAEQAAAAFMLGESVESSGSDPSRAGESIRKVGTNPFIVGSEAEEGNIFYRFVKSHPEKVQCYLLNTGGVGEVLDKQPDGSKTVRQKVDRVQVLEMAAIIRGIARGSIDWVDDPVWGTKVPASVQGVDMDRFALSKFYSAEQAEALIRELKRERVEYIESFPGLDAGVARSIKDALSP